LSAQKSGAAKAKPLGQYLCDEGLITKFQLRAALTEQFAYRALALSVTLYFSVASFGTIRPAHAEAAMQGGATQVSYNTTTTTSAPDNNTIQLASLQPMPRMYETPKRPMFQNLFGSREIRSTNTAAFTKWNEIVGRLENAGMQNWGKELSKFEALPTMAKIHAVNNYVNSVPYVEDKVNYGKSDYWATPAEFFARGGDCEDYAIAKYAALRHLGVPESNMRLAIVQDKIKNIPHAILIVYTEEGVVMLDNQIKATQNVASVTRYQPIYSINREAWWRHVS